MVDYQGKELPLSLSKYGVFTTLKQQLETTKIEEVKESDYVVILDPPEVPLISSAPKKKKSVIMQVGDIMVRVLLSI